jgi:hypothetical protein
MSQAVTSALVTALGRAGMVMTIPGDAVLARN